MTHTKDEALKLALEALKHCKEVIVERGLNGNPEFAKKWGLTLPLERSEEAIAACEQALAEQPAQPSPVPWSQGLEDVWGEQPAQQEFVCSTGLCHYRKPLTGEEMTEGCRCLGVGAYRTLAAAFEAGVRFAEAAHGIKEQPAQQEPVAMPFDDAWASLSWTEWRMRPAKELFAELHRLTSPPAQRKPLTDEEIEEVWQRVQATDFHDCVKPFARAIERAHGIKEQP